MMTRPSKAQQVIEFLPVSTIVLETDSPVTQVLLESLYSSLYDDLQVVKKNLLAEWQDIRHDLDDIGERVSALEDKHDGRNKK
ncbi:hypothetical protein NDU88_001638 [Pleurodeles waltl]|uniref:Uncharacterized protein n=1 Tax=Pleurodeles waltl TaxID=8319 RepID=A0AAV7S870_PLEWA|nr:hypothetical protein NDU88_001638 [Pleurodeles waltl]